MQAPQIALVTQPRLAFRPPGFPCEFVESGQYQYFRGFQKHLFLARAELLNPTLQRKDLPERFRQGFWRMAAPAGRLSPLLRPPLLTCCDYRPAKPLCAKAPFLRGPRRPSLLPFSRRTV